VPHIEKDKEEPYIELKKGEKSSEENKKVILYACIAVADRRSFSGTVRKDGRGVFWCYRTA